MRPAEVERTAPGDDPPLSRAGREHVRRLAVRLRLTSFASIDHSPAVRAAQTAELLAEALGGVSTAPSDLLRERTPVPAPDRLGSYPERYWSWLEKVPAHERDVDGRVLSAAVAHFGDPPVREGPPADGPDVHRLVVTHSAVIAWFVREALEAPGWRWLALRPGETSLTIIRYARQAPESLVCFNDVGHLDGG